MAFLIQALLVIICAVCANAQSSANLNKTNNFSGNISNQLQIAGGYVLDDKHVLEPGDEISFQILEDKKPSTNLLVAGSGELSIPYIGRVSAANKTCRQLATELKGPLEKDYYYQATIVIALNSLNKLRGQVLISGYVHNPGPVDILSGHDLTVGEAILRAGGFTDYANDKKVKIVRTRRDSAKRVFVVNMADVLENGKTELDVVLEPGDYIIVPSRSIRF
jgi:protein involved in polysaccharide export with SLBB domain